MLSKCSSTPSARSFRTEGLKILETPVRTPVANAFAERWIGSIRRELRDRTIVWNQHQLERLVTEYTEHYDTHRPRRSLDQQPPIPHTVSRDTDPRYLGVGQIIPVRRTHQ